MRRVYRCESCGATWLSHPTDEAIEQPGRCLRCDGVLFLVDPPLEDPEKTEQAPEQ